MEHTVFVLYSIWSDYIGYMLKVYQIVLSYFNIREICSLSSLFETTGKIINQHDCKYNFKYNLHLTYPISMPLSMQNDKLLNGIWPIKP